MCYHSCKPVPIFLVVNFMSCKIQTTYLGFKYWISEQSSFPAHPALWRHATKPPSITIKTFIMQCFHPTSSLWLLAFQEDCVIFAACVSECIYISFMNLITSGSRNCSWKTACFCLFIFGISACFFLFLFLSKWELPVSNYASAFGSSYSVSSFCWLVPNISRNLKLHFFLDPFLPFFF